MAREADATVERIVLAFDAHPPEEAALEAAAALASALNAELSGIYVEDTNLVRLAALPFIRELGVTSALPRAISAADVERALRLQAAQHREQLEALAAAFNLRWSFEVVRGQVFAAVLEHTREPDVVVFGKAAHGVTARSVTLAALGHALGGGVARRGERFQKLSLRSIVLLFDGTPRGWRALAAAHAVAAMARTRLSLLVLASGREEFERLREAARAWLAERDASARFNWLRSGALSDIVTLATAEDAAALFWYGPALDRRRLDALLAGLRCPLVLIH